VRRIYTLDGEAPGCETWRDALMRMPPTLIDDPSAGAPQPYSSGSTGKPKGLRHGLSDRNYDQRDPITELRIDRFGYRQDTIYLAPGPLSHTLSLSFAALTHQVGGVVVQMSRFRPALFLSLVEKYRVSLSQMVPMMFVQLLKTPADERAKFDISSLRSVVHSAAPCPPDIKRAMIAWWGPIISEFYSGSEGLGATIISSDEWLERPGSVGKPAWSVPHICDDQGHELPTGVCGVIYFDGRSTVQVLNDPARTEMMRHPVHKGWATFGDVGFLDADGYLYLKDRAAFVIQSGEHRIYPQEVEDVLIAHPAVADAAVFGAHDPEAGEQIRAIVVPLDVNGAGAELAHELLAYCRSRLAPETCPAAIEFEPSLPRGESGKLYKRVLQERDKGARRSTL
jgi:acyl-coenzyme A synthetase/AMP-(fatty) acid ligase